MIRHVTTKELWMKIKSDGFIKPQGAGYDTTPEKGYVSFEMYKNNKIFYRAYCFGNKHKKRESELIGLILDEKKLSDDGYEVIITTDINKFKEEFNNKKFCTKKEMELYIPHCITKQEYNEIGNFVFVKGDIPISYIKETESP